MGKDSGAPGRELGGDVRPNKCMYDHSWSRISCGENGSIGNLQEAKSNKQHFSNKIAESCANYTYIYSLVHTNMYEV